MNLTAYKATLAPEYPVRNILRCPYHDQWVRFGDSYRTCPTCHWCVRCRLLGRDSLFPHTHA